jgi:hypothetical protein
MKNHIAEELPARKFAPAAADSGSTDKNDKKESSGKSPEQKAKQAVYDIRYRARREDIPLPQAFSQYMQNSSMGGEERKMVKAKLFGKEGGGMKVEDFNPIFKDAASDNVAKALFKVFVEGTEQEQESISLTYLEELDSPEHRKYKVRVTDKNTKRSYVRMATREKINQLRANPNIESVEMTEYGEPYEGERKKGSQTAKVAAGKGLDPVGQEDGDVDNDGDKDKSDKYLMKRRGAIGNAIATRKEEFIHEAGRKKKSNRPEQFDIRKISNTVTICPTQGGNERVGLMAHNELEGDLISENGYAKFLNMVNEKINLATADMGNVVKDFQKSDAPQFKGKSKKKRQEMAIAAKLTAERGGKKLGEEMDCGSDDKKKKGEEEDPRSIKTKDNLVRNKLRAMGLKMSYEPEGEMVDEATRSAKEGVPETHRPGLSVDRRVANQNRETPGGRRALKREADARRQQQTPEAQAAKRQRDDESSKIAGINKRPRTKKQRADYEGVRRAGNLGS